MTFFLASLIIGIVGALPVLFSTRDAETKTKVTSYIILLVCYTGIFWFFSYLALPSLANPLFGAYGTFLFIAWIISAVVAFFISDQEGSFSMGFPIGGLVIFIIVGLSGCEACNSGKYANLIGSMQTDKNMQHWSQDIQPLDPTHIRLVPQELAISLAKTTLGQNGATLGSQFPLQEKYITLQKINGDYFYLIPLDYKGYTVWTNAEVVPGYVKVSATDPYAKPMLITGKKMKYTPNAFFGDNIQRRLYPKYYNKILTDYTFEENDSGHVYWVITVCDLTISWWGDVVEGVILYDPETGEDEFIKKSDIDKDVKYTWIDRIMPADLVTSYIKYWGTLKTGWWNSFWTHINLIEGETPTMNYSRDGRCIFVTPITSTNKDDHAMTGLMYTDARTGEFLYYTTSGGATEQAIIDAVNSTVTFRKWHASNQIVFENIYGKLSALVPILGENANFQGLAIVETENKRVAVGLTPGEALVEYQKVLMNSGGQISTENGNDIKEFTGKILRLGWDMSQNSGKQYYIYFPNFQHSFIVSSKLESELALTKEGDLVTIRYIKSNDMTLPTMFFKNLTLSLQSSESEKNVQEQIDTRQNENQQKMDAKDFKEELNKKSDAELQEIKKKLKK